MTACAGCPRSGSLFLDTLARTSTSEPGGDMMKRLVIAVAAPGCASVVLVGQQATPQTQISSPRAQPALTTTARNVPPQR